jgi:hypothetical protein
MGLVGTPASTPRNTGASLTMTNRSAAKSTRRGFVHPGTPPQPANVGPSGDPGVTNAKSFNSGVEGRVPPRNRRDRRPTPAGQNQAVRGPRIPPQPAKIRPSGDPGPRVIGKERTTAD